MRIAIAFVLAFSLVLAAPAGVPTVDANACLMRNVPDPWDRLNSAIDDDWTQIVLIGVVSREVRMEWDRSAPGTYRIVDEEPDERSGTFESTIRVDAVLKGEVPSSEFVLAGLNQVWQCSSGPLLPEGQRVLIFLGEWPRSPGEPGDFVWQTNLIGGQVFLTGGQALMADYQSIDGESLLGSATEVVLHVAKRLGMSEEDTQSAFDALVTPVPGENGSGPWYAAIIAGVFAVLLCGATMLRTRRR